MQHLLANGSIDAWVGGLIALLIYFGCVAKPKVRAVLFAAVAFVIYFKLHTLRPGVIEIKIGQESVKKTISAPRMAPL